MKRLFLAVLVTVLTSILLLSACGGQAPAPSPAPVPKPAPAPATTPSPTPVSVADFYKNNVVTLIVPFEPGAGSDFAARLVASYWTAATGGAMIVKNMPGGGGLLGANFIAAAKPDGLTLGIGMFSSAYIGPMILNDPALKLDPLKQTWIGAVFAEPNIACLANGLPYKSARDLQGAKDLNSAGLALAAELL